MEQARKDEDPVIQHHVMLEVNGDWVLLRTLDEDCLEQAEAFASEYAAINHDRAIVATTVTEFSGRLTPKDILAGFAEGKKFTDRKGRLVTAVDPHPAIIEDEDCVNVKFEGEDYYSAADKSGDFWDSIAVNELRRAT